MLPYEQWLHYYDRPCEICEEAICINNDEEVFCCEKCGKDICGDCQSKAQASCDVCEAKMEQDEEPLYDPQYGRTVCKPCLETCKACRVSFHSGACQAEHSKTCNALGRATRKLAYASKSLENAEAQIRATRSNLAKLERGLDKLKSKKESAQKKVQQLRE